MSKRKVIALMYRSCRNHVTAKTASRPTAVLAVIFLLFSAPQLVNAQTNSEQGRDVLAQSFSKYLHLSSYAGKSSADMIVTDTNGHILSQVGSSVEFKFRRPNKVRFDFSTPLGSRIVWCDSTTVGVFDPLSRKYWLCPAAPDMDTMLGVLDKTAQISTFMDPLYGICRAGIPGQLLGIRLRDKTTFNGHPAYVISATTKLPTPAEWSWWIDVNTLLILKVEQVQRNIQQTRSVMDHGKVVTSTQTLNLLTRDVISDARPNAQIQDSEFAYKPPAGATVRNTQITAGGNR